MQVAVVGDLTFITDFSKPGKAFSKPPHKELFQFVTSARRALHIGCPSAIVDDGLSSALSLFAWHFGLHAFQRLFMLVCE